jgi:hypothetical protein
MIIKFHPDSYRPSELPGHLQRHARQYEGRLMIGYWDSEWYRKNKPCLELPKPQDFIDPNWDPDQRRIVLEYLKLGQTLESWRGFGMCRICKKLLGSRDLTDGLYVWPEGFEHYLEEHHLRVPEEFVQHCFQRFSEAL